MRAVVPRYLKVRNGELVEAEPSAGRNRAPKVIDYTHSIRLINQQPCNHEELIRQLKDQHSREIQEKEQAIHSLEADAQTTHNTGLQKMMEALASKEQELERREMELTQKEERSSSANSRSSEDLPITLSIIEPAKMGCSEVHPRASFGVDVDGLLSASCCFPKRKQGNIEQAEPGKDIQRVAQEMEKTQDALDNLTSLLKKPKKKYKFFNNGLQKTPDTLAPPKETQRTRQNTSLCEQSERAWTDLEESIDGTAADDSKDTAEFLEDAIGDHLALRKALVELQTNTQTQMQEMKDYYESQIRMYAQLLSVESEAVAKEGSFISRRMQLHPEEVDNIDRLEPIEHAEEESQAHSLFDELEGAAFEDEY